MKIDNKLSRLLAVTREAVALRGAVQIEVLDIVDKSPICLTEILRAAGLSLMQYYRKRKKASFTPQELKKLLTAATIYKAEK